MICNWQDAVARKWAARGRVVIDYLLGPLLHATRNVVSRSEVQATFDQNEDAWFRKAIVVIEGYLKEHRDPVPLPLHPDRHADSVSIPAYLKCLFWDATVNRTPLRYPKALQDGAAMDVARLVDCGLMQLTKLSQGEIAGALIETVGFLALRRYFYRAWSTLQSDLIFQVRFLLPLKAGRFGLV